MNERRRAEEWRKRLREAGEEELGELLARHLDDFDPGAARLAFRNPFLTGEMIEELVASRRLISAYEVRRAAAFHPKTPRLEALRFVEGLYWIDLVRLGTDTRLHPVVRRAADRRLLERLAGLAVGERIAIGRLASQPVLGVLRNDPTPRVLGAVLENPRATEGLLLPLAASERAAPQALATLAAHPRWGSRYPIRAALCRNPQTPLSKALALLPMLKKNDLAAVANDPRLLLPVRRRAELLAGGGGDRRSRR
ncbi:MAG: hypothetical protein KDB94_03670 [Acidobacteria bacterium]|nr:hypothetical protein [Acidobacteriota bacterium]